MDIGFGVSRFEDYGGPFRTVSTEDPQGRPFILDQPIVTAATATAAGTDLNTLMKNALAATAPGFGGDTPGGRILRALPACHRRRAGRQWQRLEAR